MVRKSSKAGRRRTRKLRGGYYSFSGAVGPGAANWTRATEVPVAGGRRRKHKSRKSRKTRRMKGGGSFGAVSASYQGTGARGIADYAATDTKGPYVNGGAKGGAFNDYGAKPGSSF